MKIEERQKNFIRKNRSNLPPQAAMIFKKCENQFNEIEKVNNATVSNALKVRIIIVDNLVLKAI